jgi:Domain of unknown function (DUF5615)
MKILVDENIPRMTVNRLRELGHDVRTSEAPPTRAWRMLSCGRSRFARPAC